MIAPTIIPGEEISYHTALSPVHSARLFSWKGELYRAVGPANVEHVNSLFDRGIVDRLVKRRLLVGTERTRFQLENYPLVLKHERLPFVTYPFEWSAEGFKDATLAFLDLSFELSSSGIGVCDAHTWNTVFDGPQPVFVDFGSLIPLEKLNADSFLEHFRHWFLNACRLLERRQYQVGRALLRDPMLSIPDETLVEASYVPSPIARIVRRVSEIFTAGRDGSVNATGEIDAAGWQKRLLKLRHEVEAISMHDPKSAWSDYYELPVEQFHLGSRQAWDEKQSQVIRILEELRPATLHDLAGNAGWYSIHAAELGANVICSDVDEACLNRLHRYAREQNKPIHAMYMNLLNPGPGLGAPTSRGRTWPAAEHRLRCDCALALAITHHLIFRQWMDLPCVLDAMCAFTRSDLIVEFVSKNDIYVQHWCTPAHDWYTLENFTSEAKARFRDVSVVPSSPEGRYLLVCRGLKAANPGNSWSSLPECTPNYLRVKAG